MSRLASLLSFLALGVGLAGAVCFYLTYRPGGAREWLAAALHFAPAAFSQPLVYAAAATAAVATVLARFFERPLPGVPPSRRPVHSLEGPSVLAGRETAGGQARGGPAGAAAEGGIRRERDLLKLKLEALLRGRADMVAYVDELLAGAIRCRASDVHVQPRDGFTRIALRVEGELFEVASAAESWHSQIVRRIKVLAQLVPYKTDQPQDGSFGLEVSSSTIDVRVSVVPTQHGEKVALRFVRPGAGLREIDDLGMEGVLAAAFRKLLDEPQGLLVLTGPTGSGKTTTLYSALDHIHRTRGKNVLISTVEDPVEIDLPFLSQTQVDRTRGLDFAAGLRSLLRQDPNVMMVGEIRDAETARIAVQAGLTGHLILSSLHAESTAGVFARLIEMDIEPFLVASSVLACLSQRLVRCLCPDCRRPDRVDRESAARLLERGISLDAGLTFYRGEGCRTCEQSGVAGRTAVFEMLRITPELRRRMASKVPTQEIAAAAVEGGMRPLLATAVEMAAGGRISLAEALRVAG